LDWSHLLFGFDGRIGRKPFWIAVLVVTAAEIVCHLVAQRLEGERLSAIVDLAFSYPEFAIFAKRAHDRALATWVPGLFFLLGVVMDFFVIMGWGGEGGDNPGTLFLVLSFPWTVFAIALLLDLGLRRGTRGGNRFGPDPLNHA
jgi:uncharacterized membrane protein YhaH (DUF805 family)